MMKQFLKKLNSTLRIVVTLALARTFGRYEVSVYNDGVNYAKYHWRGKAWAFPTEPIEDDDHADNSHQPPEASR